jgi:hypothetical protein
MAPNTEPYLLEPLKPKYQLECSALLELPEAADDEDDDVTVEVIGLPDFVQFDGRSLFVGDDCRSDSFKIKVILKDSRGLRKEYNTLLNVVKAPEAAKAQTSTATTEVKLKDLLASNSGLLTLSFTQPLHSTSLDKINKGL